MKEREDARETLGPRLRPNSRPISARGLEELARLRDAAVDPDERARLEAIVNATVVIGPPGNPNIIAFGASVAIDAGSGKTQRFTIVGEDEVDIPNARIGLESPLARALLGARVGDSVVWTRPAGDRTVTVTSIDYGWLSGSAEAAA
jgi:transcription elongation GreA/GreB family factor